MSEQSAKQIDNAFKHHPLKDDQSNRRLDIREQARSLAHVVDAFCPDSREKSLALTKIEEAVMWANAAIARNE